MTGYTFRDFRTVLRTLEAQRDETREFERTTDAEIIEVCRIDFKRAFPKRAWRNDATKAPNFQPIRGNYLAAGLSLLYEEYWPEQAALEALRDRIALETVPDRTGELQCIYRIYAGAYRSQGFGQHKYQRNDAQHVADIVTYHGFSAEVREANDPDKAWAYEVWANIDADGWELLKLKPGQSLKEWVASCWKRGVNPRVYNPYLPTGIEEKLGVDYFGTIIQKEAA